MVGGSMQQDNTPLARIERQLERIDELTRTLATRTDLDSLRKEVVLNVVLESRITVLQNQIGQQEKRMNAMEQDQISRSDRLAAKLSPAIAAVALLITLIDFLLRIKVVP